jgi:hypothetical protein
MFIFVISCSIMIMIDIIIIIFVAVVSFPHICRVSSATAPVHYNGTPGCHEDMKETSGQRELTCMPLGAQESNRQCTCELKRSFACPVNEPGSVPTPLAPAATPSPQILPRVQPYVLLSA